MIPGVIEGNSCQITVDTGSDILLVRSDVLKAELEVPIIPLKDSRLRTVSGTTTPLQSKVDLKLQLVNLLAISFTWQTLQMSVSWVWTI